MDLNENESDQEYSLFQRFSFGSEFSSQNDIDIQSSYSNSNITLLNRKLKCSNNEITESGKTIDTRKNNIVVSNAISLEIKGRKIDEGTQTRRPYSDDE